MAKKKTQKKVTKKELETVVGYLNSIMELEPKIETGSEEQMKADILETCKELLTPADFSKISTPAINTMAAIGVEVPSDVLTTPNTKQEEEETAEQNTKKVEPNNKKTKKSGVSTNVNKKNKQQASKPEEKAGKTKEKASKPEEKTKEKTSKEVSAYGHAKGTMGYTIDRMLMKGTTEEKLIEAICQEHGRDKNKAKNKVHSHMSHLYSVHSVEISLNDKTGSLKIPPAPSKQ